jgi:hypothetical protein
MRRFIFLVLISCFLSMEAQAQTAPRTPPEILNRAVEFLKRLNALDDWTLSVDGKEEGLTPLVDSMMELFGDDVLAEVPPHDADQIGPVVLRTKENVRKWVDKLARSYVRFEFIHKRQTEGEFEGEPLVYQTPLPWKGVGVSFQIIANYSLREDRRKFTSPGALFIQYGEDGKIQRLRLLHAELAEVVPL